MGEVVDQIPCLDFSGEYSLGDQESEEWKGMMSAKVREACERHGCFLVEGYNGKITLELTGGIFMGMETLFDLPEETKKKHGGTGTGGDQSAAGRFNRYFCSPFSTLHESFGIDGAHQADVARDFTNLMWPCGNPGFSEVLNSMSSKMLDLNMTILKMVFHSFGMRNCCSAPDNEDHNNITKNVFRLIKYNVPPNDHQTNPATGLIPHTDKNFLTILCQNGVQGLEVMSREGNWFQPMIPNGCFFVIVGDSLKAWSNGRLHAAKHRVMIRGDKVRYSCGAFLQPRDDLTIEVPQRLVDEDHPLLYRPFTYSDLVTFYSTSNFSDEALELFAGV